MSAYPPRYGQPYEQDEVDLIFLTRNSQSTNRELALRLGRTSDAIAFARRWSDPEAHFPHEAEGRLRRQFGDSARRFGRDQRGACSTVEEAVQRAAQLLQHPPAIPATSEIGTTVLQSTREAAKSEHAAEVKAVDLETATARELPPGTVPQEEETPAAQAPIELDHVSPVAAPETSAVAAAPANFAPADEAQAEVVSDSLVDLKPAPVLEERPGTIALSGGELKIPPSNVGQRAEGPKRPREPRQYRPAVRAPGSPRQAARDEEQAARERSLPIEVRLVLERAGFCRISLLPRRAPGLPEELAVSGSGDPPTLVALQEQWYQDVILPEPGTLLRDGVVWEGYAPDGRSVRWALSGREIYVLCRHVELSGFISAPRLVLGEQHIVLCNMERLEEVKQAIALTGSPEPVILDTTSGVPQDWAGLRGVVPRVPVPSSSSGDILDALRPLADVEIVLEGGIRLERATWLSGYPPRIRLRGDVGAIRSVMIDGQDATLGTDGSYVTPKWDSPGEHQVWCASASRSYSIRDAAEDWEPWDAYTWSMADFSADREPTRPAICGVLVRPPSAAPEESRAIVMPASSPVLLGARPGEIHVCGNRSDVRTETCAGFPSFDPIWAMPADALRCDKRVACVTLIGHPVAVGEFKRQAGRAGRERERRVQAWCAAILDAGRKGLRTEPLRDDVAALWQEYKRRARAIWRSKR